MGLAYYGGEFLLEGEFNTGTIIICEGIPYGASFIMPDDGILRSIYVLFSTSNGVIFEEGSTIRPFVCLAISNAVDLAYTILSETITFTEPYAGGIDIPTYTNRRGSLANLSVALTAGTMVGIVVGIMGENVTAEQFGTFSISGGLLIE